MTFTVSCFKNRSLINACLAYLRWIPARSKSKNFRVRASGNAASKRTFQRRERQFPKCQDGQNADIGCISTTNFADETRESASTATTGATETARQSVVLGEGPRHKPDSHRPVIPPFGPSRAVPPPTDVSLDRSLVFQPTYWILHFSSVVVVSYQFISVSEAGWDGRVLVNSVRLKVSFFHHFSHIACRLGIFNSIVSIAIVCIKIVVAYSIDVNKKFWNL
ncbi:unnamed protein product [Phyllotreta striolata]|uniref:Uncharacterized protein n=1 Tax=Phyllotreta striolata TaxID=444603 RepID=A0A9N9XU19_PHYSR|nr:unnamed protein product [Phyllotreta striolata]